MESLNLYNIANCYDNFVDDYEYALKYIQHHTNEKVKVREYELKCLTNLVKRLMENGARMHHLDFFYYSFTIPQISKEFDILRIDNNLVINIELKKSRTTKIKKQLLQNNYYLSHLSRPTYLFTYIQDEDKLVKLDKHKGIINSDFSEVVELLKQCLQPYKGNIYNLFKVSTYLISPLNTPIRFLNRHYFLTDTQEQVKNKIYTALSLSDQYFAIHANAGTGKTLLIFDIALDICKLNKVCIIHCGILSPGHEYINEHVENIDIFSAKQSQNIDISKYNYVFIDEAHRFFRYQFDILVNKLNEYKVKCIFSLDDKQILAISERKNNISKSVNKLSGRNIFELKGKIRTNKKLAAFIKTLFDNNKKNPNYTYDNVDIVYCSNFSQAEIVKNNYVQSGYEFINYTPSIYYTSSMDYFTSKFNTHQVIGQEFDNVVVYLDNHFAYKDNILLSKTGPNPNHIFTKLLYQAVTRSREKLCLIIVDNKPLFKNILNILHGNKISNISNSTSTEVY